MSESRSMTSSIRRILVPLIVAAVLVVGTVLFAGSSLIRIEDVTVNRILAGTYGAPDWRVQEMNPLLAQMLTLLYRIVPAINWYGVLLLALLLIAAAAGISLTARRPGGLWPAVMIVSPLVILFTSSVISTTVCALCAVVGALSLMEGIQRKKDGIGRAVLGAVLYIFAAMLSLRWAIFLAVCALICWLPCAIRESRLRGLFIGVPIMAVLVAALFGYSALMYNTPELSSYRENYTLYEKLQHSSLRAESDALIETYGYSVMDEDHADHDHDGDGVPDGEDHVSEEDVIIPPNSFDAVGWNINDSSLFFSRYASDSQLVDPEVLRTLDAEASYWDFTPSRLFSELFATVKKPQFLMMIGLFVVGSLALLITSRRRGLVVLLAAVVAFGGHVLSIARYYNTFADIAPFYLLSIGILLYFFNGEDAKAWMHRVFGAPWLRIGLSALVMVVFVAALGGLLYYNRITPANPVSSGTTIQAIGFIKPYITGHKDMLFVGDNPNDRYKPETLTAPVRGEDENLIAGSYDLYSPRAAALMEQYGITNPLRDAIDREDIGYVTMGFPEPVSYHVTTTYGIYLKQPTELASLTNYAEMVILLSAFTQEEIDTLIAEDQAAYESAMEYLDYINDLEEQGLLDGYIDAMNDAFAESEAAEGSDATAAPEASPTATPATTPEPTPVANG